MIYIRWFATPGSKKYACSPNYLNEKLMSWKSHYCQFYPAFVCEMCFRHCCLPVW